jgi:HlyD family secretion protein
MKVRKTVIIGGAVIILMIVSGWLIFGRGDGKNKFATAAVRLGSLTQTVEVNGVLKAADEVDLAFNSSGLVSVLFVEEGNQVQSGDLLAALNTDELQAQADYYAYAVALAQANLDKEAAASSDEEVALSEAKVASAETILAAAQRDLANEELDNTEDLSEAYDDLVQILRNSSIEIRAELSEADNVLGLDNAMSNDDYQDILSANNWESLQTAVRFYPLAKTARDRAEESVYALDSAAAASDIEAAAALSKTALNQTALVLLYVRRVLDATNIDTPDFTSADLIILEATIDAARTAIETEQAALTAQEQVIAQLKISNQDEVDAAAGLVEKYEKALIEARAALAQVKAGPRQVDLAPYQAALAQARANYGAANARLMNAQIISPIDGQVSAVNLAVGEPAALGAAAITVQATAEPFQVTANVSETDIAKVALDDLVSVTFDAFGEEKKFSGRVAKIDPAEKTIEGVVYYEVAICLDALAETTGLKPGMTANLVVSTAQKDNILLVPQRAILERADGSKYVRLVVAESFVEEDVEVGIRGDDGWTEVLAGLTEGQTVITSLKN